MTTTTDATDAYWAGGKRIELTRDPRLFAVRFRPGRRDSDSVLSAEARALLKRSARSVGLVRGHGIQLYEADDPAALDERVERSVNGERIRSSRLVELGREEPVEFAAPVLRSAPGDPDTIIPAPRFAVGFKPGVTREQIDELNAAHGVTIESELGYAENGFVLIAPDGDGALGSMHLADLYYRSGLVDFATPDLIRPRHIRSVVEQIEDVEDPAVKADGAERTARSDLIAHQWHLDQIEAPAAWTTTRGSPSIVVAILDDGFDLSHPEFGGKIVFDFDFEDEDDDASAIFGSENHGTACAGVAIAKGVRASGSAPGCSFMAIRTPFQLGMVKEAEMFQRAADEGADVISCSWGPADGTGAVDPLPDTTRAAIDYCTSSGRGGKGIPIFWAAGNGSESVSNDGYASYAKVIAVAASTSEGGQSWYSDFGPEVAICAPSNGGQKGILTTDRQGSAGYNSGSVSLGDVAGDYTNDFGGTSSATPLAAGVAGLILSVAPDLTWQQVKGVLQETADKIGGAAEYDSSGHSDRFGSGRVNARAAVERASTMTSTGSGTTSGGAPVTGSSTPFVHPQGSAPRTGPPPVFDVGPAGRAHMAIEVATESRLFDYATWGATRSESNFFPLWDSGETSTAAAASTYALPLAVWQRLRHASQLFVRVHVANDPSTWAGYDVSTPDDSASLAPHVTITSQAQPSPFTSGGGAGAGSGTGSSTSSVRYPSGTSLPIVHSPADGVDYSDPVAGGVIPLVLVDGHLDDRVSDNFIVKEFAARRIGGRSKVDHARISPELVEGLQQLRDRIGKAIKVSSGYRYPALNAEVGGAERSQHMAGRAVDMRVTGMRPLDLAAEVLDVFGFDIGLGLGKHTVHVDTRGSLATWAYAGAEMSEAEFDAWVRDRRESRSNGAVGRSEAAPLDGAVAVEAPAEWVHGDEVPVFRVRPGVQEFWGLEIAASEDAFEHRVDRTAHDYWRSWNGALPSAGDAEWISVVVPEAEWELLATNETLLYRAFTSADANTAEMVEFSPPQDDSAPVFEVRIRRSARSAMRPVRSAVAVTNSDEALWRDRSR